MTVIVLPKITDPVAANPTRDAPSNGRCLHASARRMSGADDKRLIIERIVQALRSSYVFPDWAEQMTAFIARGVTEGGYDSIADPQVLAESLTRDLRSASRDFHLYVQYQPHLQALRKLPTNSVRERAISRLSRETSR